MAKDIHWYPGHMAKARREIESRVKLVDIIIELRDARAPASTSNPIINQIEKQKPHLVILTKKDLADPVVTEAWLKYFEKNGTPAMALDLMNFNAYQQIVQRAKSLLKDKIEREKQRGLKPRPVRALVVGIPNVGKSTLINRLAKRRATITGDRPGVTRAQQIIKVSNDFELFDTPGILWPRFDDPQVAMHIALVGSIKNTILPLDEVFIYALKFLSENYPQALIDRYNMKAELEKEDWVEVFCRNLSKQKNFRLVRQELDYDRIYDLLFNDLIKGNLGTISWERPVDE